MSAKRCKITHSHGSVTLL